uniref:Connector enhancer of kinase suppressor of Ras 1 n=1 Tax=Myripristis murdjan TaxID=586833 RepID=A0A668AGJ6_9TELE
MEPITSWSEERVSEWLQGLDAPLQQYPFSQWQLSGLELLQLSSQDLERLGVHKIGHQELILEAVEKLCSLTYGMGSESLRSLTEKLRAVAHTLQMGIQNRWRVNTYDGRSATKLPAGVLQVVVELITSAKGLFSLLNRYQFFQLSGYTASKSIIGYCQELGAIIHKVGLFMGLCRQLVAVCDDVLSSSPEALLSHTAQLESVDLVPVSPGDHLGIEITSTCSSNHYVTGTATESANDFCEKILAGDEVIKVNDQIVVGWSRANLVKKLKENPSGVTLVLKKIPGSLRQEEEEEEEQEGEEEEESNQRHSIFERVAASVRSLSFSEVQGIRNFVLGKEIAALFVDPCQITFTQHPPPPPSRPSILPGMTTALSRRRVSCRELGRPDCDGWLWKKRKESSVFITQKWQRFWFVLKGPSLYWYTSQQEEKAEGLVQIASYNIESAGEHKRKYVFKMRHNRFQNFFFAADNVTDMSKWINCLITAIQKHRKFCTDPPDSEEECYSETESEDERSPSPRRRNKVSTVSSTTPRSPPPSFSFHLFLLSPPYLALHLHSFPAPLCPGTPEDEMGVMFNKLKEGGVSLIGQDQPLTHDHFRKSFIRRNKNPIINEKAHTLRALQSTLKAKEAELQLINKILEDSDLTAAKFRQWKENNEELHQEIERLALLRASREQVGAVQDAPAEEVGMETVATETPASETGGACRLSLSDGEQLVDVEPSDVLLEIPAGSQNAEQSPVLELSLGSLRDSISRQLSEMAGGGEATEQYFYI